MESVGGGTLLVISVTVICLLNKADLSSVYGCSTKVVGRKKTYHTSRLASRTSMKACQMGRWVVCWTANQSSDVCRLLMDVSNCRQLSVVVVVIEILADDWVRK